MSLNNGRSVSIVAYYADNNTIYKEFRSIADAALHFISLMIQKKREIIRWAITTKNLLLDKYKLSKKQS